MSCKFMRVSSDELLVSFPRISSMDEMPSSTWRCRTSGAPFSIAWMNNSEKVIFRCTDGKAYERLIGGYPLTGIINSFYPLYFSVREVNEVMSTEQPCDLAYEFGDGLLNLREYPNEFPIPGILITPDVFVNAAV